MNDPKEHTQLAKTLYLHPIMSFFNNIHIKVGFALILQAFSMYGLKDSYLVLLESPFKLILLIILLVFIDFASGILKAFKRKDKISSWRMRQTIIKSLEYIFFLGSIVIFANAFKDNSDIIQMIAKQIKTFAFFLVAIIEINSIVDNISNKNITTAWKRIKEKFNLDKQDDEE